MQEIVLCLKAFLAYQVKPVVFPWYLVFLFYTRENKTKTEYSESEVEVKMKTMFSLKLGLLEWYEKVLNIFLIWIILKER